MCVNKKPKVPPKDDSDRQARQGRYTDKLALNKHRYSNSYDNMIMDPKHSCGAA